jgi:hypothetical protein
MKKDFDEVAAAFLAPVFLHPVQSFRALGRVRSIYIEEQDVPASVPNALHNLLNLRHIGAPIKMHTENVQPGARELEACSSAETAR